jgi:Rrf2 family protein
LFFIFALNKNNKMVSKTCEYAIRAMLFVAQKSKNDSKVGVKQIAKAIDSPEPFIAKILQDLGKKGLVLSSKGPTGGFYLDKAGLKKSLADIVNAIDGDNEEFVVVRKHIKAMMQNAKLGDYNTALELGEKYLKR